jgi:tRNA(Ile)-lysidine synthase
MPARGNPADLFREAVRRHEMIGPGDRVLAAVSGGGDSVLMFLMLADLRTRRPFTLNVAHLNHGLRDAESDADEAFVRELASRFSLPLVADRVDLTRKPGQSSSLEERARVARREFLIRTAKGSGCNRIALGHTLDDQAETILMWLLRGTGRGGLAGMEPVTTEGMIRPLVLVRRSEVRDHLRSMGEPFREDASNDDTRRLRSRIRLQLLPVLEKGFPGSVERLAAEAGLIGAEEAWLDRAARGLINESDGALSLEGARDAAGRVLARRAVRLAAARTMDPRRLEMDHVEAILGLAEPSMEGRGVDLPGGFRAERRGGGVVFQRRER